MNSVRTFQRFNGSGQRRQSPTLEDSSADYGENLEAAHNLSISLLPRS